MKDLALDSDGDLKLGSTTEDFNFKTDLEELKQKIWLLLNTNEEELDWNTDIGISFLDLLVNFDDQENLEKIINDYLVKQLPDIIDNATIISSKNDKQKRNLILNLQVNLKSGVNFNLDTNVRG
ncbi:hypothetical protein DY120_07425 [Apilactobacillus micheneri]|uniref:Uncharacterized protein n=1 Tax=Apilactobacillus micheneri TaxID=1899430 RepID=A0ABY2YZI1_9LACO|nr:hypothetical protein [Apilactobacillus micheneri]TPR23128.1 hypothetical protein DY114_07410 [Apilactobacillus micheneri]TPR24446.1 hypothetical protein DY111_07425 [Apilactobacillus micheneri]TPR29393.1 hypothetical protein DY120_07425 [Apilactobacillus micheneri]TPR34600.1 hypothetical protein DY027_07415 [Apilactobacillus micheneri]